MLSVEGLEIRLERWCPNCLWSSSIIGFLQT